MNRSPIRCAAIAALLLAPVALGAEFREGNEYFRLPVPVETRDPTKIEVVEVFSYGCIHCYQLEPVLNGWLAVQGDDVDFHRLPMATRNLRTLAQAFYTARAMDVLPAVHMPMFENIHEYGIDMSRPQFIRRMFVQQAKVDEEKFASIFDSFSVNTQVRQADAQTRLYRVQGTPSMIVDGRFLVDTVSSGTARRMLQVVDHLIAEERARRAAVESAEASEPEAETPTGS